LKIEIECFSGSIQSNILSSSWIVGVSALRRQLTPAEQFWLQTITRIFLDRSWWKKTDETRCQSVGHAKRALLDAQMKTINLSVLRQPTHTLREGQGGVRPEKQWPEKSA